MKNSNNINQMSILLYSNFDLCHGWPILLLKKSPSIFAVISINYTALIAAIVAQEEDFVKMLLERGADYTIAANSTPLSYARLYGNPQIIRLLIKAGATE